MTTVHTSENTPVGSRVFVDDKEMDFALKAVCGEKGWVAFIETKNESSKEGGQSIIRKKKGIVKILLPNSEWVTE